MIFRGGVEGEGEAATRRPYQRCPNIMHSTSYAVAISLMAEFGPDRSRLYRYWPPPAFSKFDEPGPALNVLIHAGYKRISAHFILLVLTYPT